MSDNMRIWNQVAQPPPEALKTIGGGRLKGMTDIKPQWRYKALTKLLGPCGVGWKYDIDRLWLEPTGDEVIAFAQISLCILQDSTAQFEGSQWSEPIPGIGGSKLVTKETKGPYNSDEAYKMAVTDALSVALKVLGFGADVYMGQWTGSKYANGNREPLKEPLTEENPFEPGDLPSHAGNLPPAGTKGINNARAITGHAEVLGWSEEKLAEWLKARNCDDLSKAKAAQAKALLAAIKEEK